MNADIELDRILTGWLAEGAERLPADDVSIALGQVARTPQRRSRVAPRGTGAALGIAARVSVGVVVAVMALATTWTAIRTVPEDLGAGSTGRLDMRWASGLTPETVAFTALLPAGAPAGINWRAAAYDSFDLGGWSQTPGAVVDVPAGGSLLPASADLPPDQFAMPIRVTVRPAAPGDGLLVSPGTPVRVDVDASVRTVGADRWLASVEIPAVAAYTVDARLLRLDEAGPLTADRLRAAGTDYPDDIAQRFTAVPEGALGPDARSLLAAVLAATPSRHPYDLALAIQSSFADPARFRYEVTPGPCDDPSVVECLARSRAGYCMHYASAMAILLRSAVPENPIPTRIVQGFLPGERSGRVETVTSTFAHAWVEVYFDGIGWVPFDPTPGGVGRPTVAP